MEVRIISAQETRPLRHLVLWPHIEKTEDCVIDIDNREDAIHIGAFENDQLISVCSLFELSSQRINQAKQYRLRAMATHPNFRGMNAGKRVVQFALELTRNMGFDVLWCDARQVALGFYEKMGFTLIDEWYEVPKIGLHKTAFYQLRK
jgi:GNAT superfamily N-acetyltransferase